MTNFIKSVIVAVFCAFTLAGVEAQIQAPAPSPESTLKQRVGLVDVEINYSRPGVKDRTIFGDMLPFGQEWRTGANAPTTVDFSDDVMIGGQNLSKGKYILTSIPDQDTWTIQFKDPESGDEALRLQVKPEEIEDLVETFTINVANIRNNTATIDLEWEYTRVSIPVSLNTDEKVFASIEQVMNGPSANDYYAAASYYLSAGKDLNQAREWADKAIEMTGGNFFWMIHTKALIEAELGMKKEAIETAEASIKAAKAAGDTHYVLLNEKLIEELKN